MYKIIGADQSEYGPVSEEQVRDWIVQGRANGATLAQAEGSSDWKPLSSFPEFAALFAGQPGGSASSAAAPEPGAARARIDPSQIRDYDIDIGSCLSRAWELFKQQPGLLIGTTVLFLLLLIGVNQLIGWLSQGVMQPLVRGEISPGPILILMLLNIPVMALSGVMTGGYYAMLLKLIRGQPAGIGDLFSGFGSLFVPLALAGVLVQFLTFLGFLACVAPGIYLSVAWILTTPLIVDQHMAVWTAMETSRKVVTRRWWLMFCLLLVMALIGIAGFLACCVGLLVAVPLGLSALIYAYEDILRGSRAVAG